MKTIKVIDLLNKIANGEKVPDAIKWGCHDFKWFVYEYKAKEELGEPTLLDYLSQCPKMLNDEVEIIKEKKKTLEEEFEEYNKNKKIDKISLHFDEDLSEFLATTSINALDYEEICQGGFERLLIDKINEIIDYLDYLKSKGEE